MLPGVWYASAAMVVGSVTATVEQGSTTLDWTNPLTWLQVAGPLAAIPLLFLTRRIVTRQELESKQIELDRAVRVGDEYKQQRDDAVAVLQDQLLPTVIQFTNTARELIPLLRARVTPYTPQEDDDAWPQAPSRGNAQRRRGGGPGGRT